MKNVLKGWLADNTVTGEKKDDKILVLESAGSLNQSDILAAMRAEDTGLRDETMNHSIDLYNRIIANKLLSGYSVNTGLFRAVPQFKGVIEDGVWNPKKNYINIVIIQDKILREGAAKTGVKILGEKGGAAYIIGGEDTATRATDGSVTPGRTFRLKGKNIKITGTHERVGAYVVPATGSKIKLAADMIVLNNPSEVILLLPSDLAEGNYDVELVTQCSGSTKTLKEPRTLTKAIYVGNDGGDVENPVT